MAKEGRPTRSGRREASEVDRSGLCSHNSSDRRQIPLNRHKSHKPRRTPTFVLAAMTDPRAPLPARREFGNRVPLAGASAGGTARPSNTHQDVGLPAVHSKFGGNRFVHVLALGLPTLTVVFAVVMAGFLLAESIADAVAVRFLRFVGVNVLILLIADALSLAFVLGLKSWVERMANSNSPSPPAASHDTSRSPIRSPPPPPA